MLKKETMKLIFLFLLAIVETIFAVISMSIFMSLMLCYLIEFDMRVVIMQIVLLTAAICGLKASLKDQEEIKERLEK